MSLQVLPMTTTDIPACFKIRDLALLPSQAPISCLLFKPAFTPRMLERETERLSAHLETLFFKVVENDIMISCIRARHVPQRISTPEIKLPEWQDGCGVGSVAWYECWKALAETKRECFGNVGHIYVDLLVTDPAYQRRGAGAALLQKIAEIADQIGQPIYLVSTQAGRKAYERASYVAVKESILDLVEMGETKLGREGRETFTYMVRQPRKDIEREQI